MASSVTEEGQGPAKRAKPKPWATEEKLRLLRAHIHSLRWPLEEFGVFRREALPSITRLFDQTGSAREATGLERQLRNLLAGGTDGAACIAETLRDLTVESLSSTEIRAELEWSPRQDRTLLAAHIEALPPNWEGAGRAATNIEGVVTRFRSFDETHDTDSVVRRLCALLNIDAVTCEAIARSIWDGRGRGSL